MSYATIKSLGWCKTGMYTQKELCTCKRKLMKNGYQSYCVKCQLWFLNGNECVSVKKPLDSNEYILYTFPIMTCPCGDSMKYCTNDGNRTQECNCGKIIMSDGELKVECLLKTEDKNCESEDLNEEETYNGKETYNGNYKSEVLKEEETYTKNLPVVITNNGKCLLSVVCSVVVNFVIVGSIFVVKSFC